MVTKTNKKLVVKLKQISRNILDFSILYDNDEAI